LDYEKLEGELRKLGFDVGATTILTVLLRHSIPPALERGRQGSSWRTFLNHYKDQLIACDFFTVETLTLQTLYVLFFRTRYAPGSLRRMYGASGQRPASRGHLATLLEWYAVLSWPSLGRAHSHRG
jgi:hypothetical protein